MFSTWKSRIKAKLPDRIANLVASNQELQLKVKIIKEKQQAWHQTRTIFKDKLDEVLQLCAKQQQHHQQLQQKYHQELRHHQQQLQLDVEPNDKTKATIAANYTMGSYSRRDRTFLPLPLPALPPLPQLPQQQQTGGKLTNLSPSLTFPPPLTSLTASSPSPTSRRHQLEIPSSYQQQQSEQKTRETLVQKVQALYDFKMYVEQARTLFNEEAKSFLGMLDTMALCTAKQDSLLLIDLWSLLLDTLSEEDSLCKALHERRKTEKDERQNREAKRSSIESNASTTKGEDGSGGVGAMSEGIVKTVGMGNGEGRVEFGHNGGLISLELSSILVYNEEVQETIFKLVVALMLRHEFNVGLNAINKVTNRPQSTPNFGHNSHSTNHGSRSKDNPPTLYSLSLMSKEEGLVAFRYREMLIETQRWVNKKLIEARLTECFYGSSPIGTFCSQVLAVNSIRLPWVMDLILAKLTLTPQQRQSLLKVIGELPSRESSGSFPDEKRVSQQQNYLLIFGWKALNDYLDQNYSPPAFTPFDLRAASPGQPSFSSFQIISLRPESETLEQEAFSLDILSRETFSTAFMAMWFAHVESVLKLDKCFYQTTDGEWVIEIKGYVELKEWFLHYTYCRPETNYSRFQTDTIKSMLSIDRRQVNNVMKVALTKTQLYDFSAVIEGLNLLQTGFITIRNNKIERANLLPPNFDILFFIKALDLVVQTDHFRCLQKTLTLIYFCSSLFVRGNKKMLFSDFLMDKYFFDLFLHWNSIVRNTFHQLLAFKIKIARDTIPRYKGADILDVDVEEELEVDAFLRLRLEHYLFALKSQVNVKPKQSSPRSPFYSPHLEVYVPKAITEFMKYCDMFVQWEASGNRDLPALQPLYPNSEPCG